jgi:hypothetical protein
MLALQKSDGLHGVRAADGFARRLRAAEVLHLAVADQLLDGTRDVLNGTFGSTRC